MATPPIAGPTVRAVAHSSAESPIARPIVSRPTRSYTHARSTGCSIALHAPSKKPSPANRPIEMFPVAMSTAVRHASTAVTALFSATIRHRSKRSARSPPAIEKSRNGNCVAAETSPSHTGEFVSFTTSQPCATLATQKPESANADAIKYAKNRRFKRTNDHARAAAGSRPTRSSSSR
jgi:hypothetical protein